MIVGLQILNYTKFIVLLFMLLWVYFHYKRLFSITQFSICLGIYNKLQIKYKSIQDFIKKKKKTN